MTFGEAAEKMGWLSGKSSTGNTEPPFVENTNAEILNSLIIILAISTCCCTGVIG